MDEKEGKCNVKLSSNYFSANVSILAVVFRRQIQKTNNFGEKLSEAKMLELVLVAVASLLELLV